jgi:hypothetical protein
MYAMDFSQIPAMPMTDKEGLDLLSAGNYFKQLIRVAQR